MFYPTDQQHGKVSNIKQHGAWHQRQALSRNCQLLNSLEGEQLAAGAGSAGGGGSGVREERPKPATPHIPAQHDAGE